MDGAMGLIFLEREQPGLEVLHRGIVPGALGLPYLLLELLTGAALTLGLHPPQTIR
jgi:hypothetical protein